MASGSARLTWSSLDPDEVEGDEEAAGGAAYVDQSADDPGIHDLENVGDTTIRYTTVELLEG